MTEPWAEGLVFRLDTVSKLLSPGFRLGWVTGPKHFIKARTSFVAWTFKEVSIVVRVPQNHHPFLYRVFLSKTPSSYCGTPVTMDPPPFLTFVNRRASFK